MFFGIVRNKGEEEKKPDGMDDSLVRSMDRSREESRRGRGKWRMAAWFNEKPRLRDRSPFLAAWKSYRINPSPRLNSQKFAQFDHANRISRSNRSASVRASGRAVSVLTPARRLPVQSRIINNV